MQLRHLLLSALVLILLVACGSPAFEPTDTHAAPIARNEQDNSSTTTSLVAVPPTPSIVTSATPLFTTELAQTCPVTLPPDPPFTPPAPYSPQSPWQGDVWYGSDALWTLIPHDGTWARLPHNPEGYTQKIFWWRKGYDWQKEPLPALTVTGQRLDAPAPPLNASLATNAFAQDIQSAMLVGVDFPTLGCWEITKTYGDARLRFVVLVAPAP